MRTKNHPSSSYAHGPRAGRKFSLVEEGTRSDWRTHQGSSAMSQSTSYSSLTNLGGRPPHVITANDPTNVRRKSVSHLNNNQASPPTGRKSSLPTLPQQACSISMARWLSMDQVKPRSADHSHEYSHQTSMSSGCSQETVIEMDTKFSSVDNVYYSDASNLGTRSPSSPNVATDRDVHMSLDFSSVPRLSDWPSSPCLPTIREDEQTYGPGTPSKSSPGRSVSHDCLPKKASAVQQNHHETGICSQGNSDSFHAFESIYDQANDQLNVEGSVILNMNPHQNLTSDNQYYSGTKATNVSTTSAAMGTMTPLKDTNPRSIPQSSVVIAIPDYEHQF